MNKHRLAYGIALAGALIALVAVAFVYRTTLGGLVQPARLAAQFEQLDSLRWMPFALVGAYVFGGLIMFPVTLLGATSALLLPPHKAALVSFTGIMLSAALLHWIGKRLLRGRLRSALGATMERLDKTLSDRSILTVATLRMIPLAPFTLVNVAAGALGLKFRDYMVGTALGIAPGVVVTALCGNQIRAFCRHPSLRDAAILGLFGLLWIATVVSLQKWAAHHRRRRGASVACAAAAR